MQVWRFFIALVMAGGCCLAWELAWGQTPPLPKPWSTLPTSLPQTQLPLVVLKVGQYSVQAQVARSAQAREQGLMFRHSMGPNDGMLFVFEQPDIQCFWMKNTALPLTAAFIADDGRVVNFADMQPQSTQAHCSQEPVRFVLEVHQGWFSKPRLQATSAPLRVQGLPAW